MTTINPVQTPGTQTPAFKGKLKNKIMSLLTVNPSKFIEMPTKTIKSTEPQTLSKAIESHLSNEAAHAAQMPLELLTEKQKNLIKTACAKEHYKKINL